MLENDPQPDENTKISKGTKLKNLDMGNLVSWWPRQNKKRRPAPLPPTAFLPCPFKVQVRPPRHRWSVKNALWVANSLHEKWEGSDARRQLSKTGHYVLGTAKDMVFRIATLGLGFIGVTSVASGTINTWKNPNPNGQTTPQTFILNTAQAVPDTVEVLIRIKDEFFGVSYPAIASEPAPQFEKAPGGEAVSGYAEGPHNTHS